MRLDADGHVARAEIPVTSWTNRLLSLVVYAAAILSFVGFFAFVRMSPAAPTDGELRIEPTFEEIDELEVAMFADHERFADAEIEVTKLEAALEADTFVADLAVADMHEGLENARVALDDYSNSELNTARRCLEKHQVLSVEFCRACKTGCMSVFGAAAIVEKSGIKLDIDQYQAAVIELYVAKNRDRREPLDPVAYQEAKDRQEAVRETSQKSTAAYKQAVRQQKESREQLAADERARSAEAGRIGQGRIVGLVVCVFMVGVLMRVGRLLWAKPRMVKFEIHSHGVKIDNEWLGTVTGCNADHSAVVIRRADQEPFVFDSWIDPAVAVRLAHLIDRIALADGDAAAEAVAKAEIEALDAALRSKIGPA